MAHEIPVRGIEIGREHQREMHPNRIIPLVVTQRVNDEQPHPVAPPRTVRAPAGRPARRRERIW